VIRRARRPWLLLFGLAVALVPLAPPAAAQEEQEEEGLQQRLTEREDKRRPLEPWTAHPFGHTLSLGGEYELELGAVRRRVLESEVDGKPVREADRWLLANVLTLEAFYTIGAPLSVFVQAEAALEEDLLGRTFEGVSDRYLERGEMWLYSEDVLGSGLSVDLGRLDFEDDRRWWWDDELDALRLEWERDTFDVALALAYELGSSRSDQSFVDPEQERVLRLLLECSWDFHENHSLQLFGLHQDDHSATERPGDSVAVEREDDSDARLTWVGLRQTGVFDLGPRGLLGYWLDTGLVSGRERLIELGDVAGGRAPVETVERHEVDGFGIDAGLSWLLPLPFEPRVFAGYAFGSAEYRQSGVHDNEPGFGGVERFDGYGALLRPELSNLNVATLGAGISLLRSSSLDLVYHHYRLHERAEDLRDAELQFELDGSHHQLGHEVDLVLALEEWERLEFTIAAAALRTSNAFDGTGGRRWLLGGFFAVRYGF
jgi:hypothetical protein